MNITDDIVRSGLCAGCGLCEGIGNGSVKMRYSSDGFLRPETQMSLSEYQAQLINKACPGISVEPAHLNSENHVLWGPIELSGVGASTDPALAHHASSGGMLSGLATYLLERRLVDRVIHISASRDSPIENVIVESRDKFQVYAAAGSRYSPSAPLARLEAYLSGTEKTAIIAKPCDIAALRTLAQHDLRIDERIPYMLSFFCAGIPSLSGTHAILDKLGAPLKDVRVFNYRGDGWPGYATAELRDGSTRRMSYAASWGDTLSGAVQFRCKICPDGTGAMADIVCGDAWRCDERGYPMFEEDEGRSLTLARTTKGVKLLQNAVANGYVTFEGISSAGIEQMQPGQAKRRKAVLARVLAMKMVGRRTPRYVGLGLYAAAKQDGLFRNIRSFLGMIKRLIYR